MKLIVVTAMVLSLGLLSACSGTVPPSVESPSGACAGLSDASVNATVAELRRETEGVERLYEPISPKTPARTVGAVVRIRATPGMSPQWLGRALTCHARGAGYAESPMALAGVRSEIIPTSTGFAVAFRSSDPTVAAEVLRRASAGTW